MQAMTIKKNQTLFAVTDQHTLIPLVITDIQKDIQELEGWLEVTTELADKEASRHQSAHHQAYFRKLFIEPDGASSRGGYLIMKTLP
jgi:hypothetical protein